ncbi:MAG: HEAT repeat domain-containing protein [Candidatus Thorarchaeota archaeon]
MNVQDEDFNKAVKDLFHGDTMARVSAAITLGHLKEGRVTNLLVKAIKSEKDPIVINRIIEAMGEIKNAKATFSIIEFLKREVEKPENEQDKNRLFLIIESLAKIGDKRALEHLGIILESCDNEIKALTEEALECIDPNWKNNIKNK